MTNNEWKRNSKQMTTSNTTTLMTECRECGGAGARTHDHPNDPWARVFESAGACEGTGEVAEERNRLRNAGRGRRNGSMARHEQVSPVRKNSGRTRCHERKTDGSRISS